jgi:Rod binding domain-containing protein
MTDLPISIRPVPMPLTPGLAGAMPGRVAPGPRPVDKDIEKVAKDFESVLIHKLMEEMQRTVDESGLLEDGASGQVKGIFWHYLAQDVADGGGMGLWQDIYRQMAGSAPVGPMAQRVEELR